MKELDTLPPSSHGQIAALGTVTMAGNLILRDAVPSELLLPIFNEAYEL